MRLTSRQAFFVSLTTLAVFTAAACSEDETETPNPTSTPSGPTVGPTTSTGMGGMNVGGSTTTDASSAMSTSITSSSGMGGDNTGGMNAGGMGGTGGTSSAGGMGGMGGMGGATTTATSTTTTGGGGTMVVLDEDFTDDAAITKEDGAMAVASFFSDGSRDYWGITDGLDMGDFDGDTPPDVTNVFMGFTGNFLVMEDLDGEGLTLPAVTRWNGLSIAGLTNLSLSFKAAEGDASDGNEDHDAADFVRFEVAIDGGAPTVVFEFRSDMGTNGSLREDTNLDGTGDGATVVSATAATFTKAIAGTGNTLDLIVSASLDAGDEDIALDDIVITGTN